jgi:S1-C subfamily serine protease
MVPGQGPYLGIDETPVVDGGVRGMQVLRIYPGSAAERAGLQAGDVIHSANGYAIQEHGNLTWVISNLPPNGVLQMNVRSARDGVEHVISAQVP